jgi:hypothetical protein
MAVDTADKRASVLGLGLAALLVLPSPGSIDQPDRQHVAFSYRGLQADVSGEVDALAYQIIVAAEDRTVIVEAEDRTILVEGIAQ